MADVGRKSAATSSGREKSDVDAKRGSLILERFSVWKRHGNMVGSMPDVVFELSNFSQSKFQVATTDQQLSCD